VTFFFFYSVLQSFLYLLAFFSKLLRNYLVVLFFFFPESPSAVVCQDAGRPHPIRRNPFHFFSGCFDARRYWYSFFPKQKIDNAVARSRSFVFIFFFYSRQSKLHFSFVGTCTAVLYKSTGCAVALR
jgi:hypothetical protein